LVSRAARRALGAFVAAVGYILSPLSPWNDAFVNAPIAYAVAKLLHRLLGLNEFIGFQLGYMASNIVGMAMLFWGTSEAATGKPLDKRNLAKSILFSLVYSVAASLILAALGLIQPPP